MALVLMAHVVRCHRSLAFLKAILVIVYNTSPSFLVGWINIAPLKAKTQDEYENALLSVFA